MAWTVNWSPPDGQQGSDAPQNAPPDTLQPTRDFVRNIWQWLSVQLQRQDPTASPDSSLILAESCTWPILPLTGGKLQRLQLPAQVRALSLAPPSHGVHGRGITAFTPLQVLRPGDWPDTLTSALATLGCRLAEIQLWQEHGMTLPSALTAFSQPPSAAGVLDALAAARNSAAALDSPSRGGHSTTRTAEAEWLAGLAQLSVAEKRQLRGFVLQGRWCSLELGAARLALLRSLPIFERHSDDLAHEMLQAAGMGHVQPEVPSALEPHVGRDAGAFTALTTGLFLAPPCVPAPQLLGACFLRPDSDSEVALLRGERTARDDDCLVCQKGSIHSEPRAGPRGRRRRACC